MTIRDDVARFRRELIERDNAVRERLTAAYRDILESLESDRRQLMRLISDRRSAGETVSRTWLLRQELLQRMIEQVERELQRVMGVIEGEITANQIAAVEAAQQQSLQLMDAALGPRPATVSVSFAQLQPEVIRELVGILEGRAIAELLSDLPPQAAQEVRDAILTGVGRGRHPNTIARMIARALGGNLVRARRLSRTAVLYAYRGASSETYKANRNIVNGWRWTATLDKRTCPACIALDGREFPVDTPFKEHWNGRCTAVPITKSWAELGFSGVPDRRPHLRMQSGADWFAKQPPEIQREILGPAAYKGYQSGDFGLEDFIKQSDDRILGEIFHQAPLKDLVSNARWLELVRGQAA